MPIYATFLATAQACLALGSGRSQVQAVRQEFRFAEGAGLPHALALGGGGGEGESLQVRAVWRGVLLREGTLSAPSRPLGVLLPQMQALWQVLHFG